MKAELQKIGEVVYLGEQLPLYGEYDPNQKKTVIEWQNNNLMCRTSEKGTIDISKALKRFYKKECRRLVNEEIKKLQPKFKEKVKSVTIESSNVRWGSCNSNRELTFHWKLVLFPMDGLKYVVIHEMCHFSHLNHDRSFWRLVGKHCPNYKESMAIIGSEKTRTV